MLAYYNEIDSYCCAWLEELMGEGLIPQGAVDSRSIKDVDPEEINGKYKQCHFFAGIGGWAYALRLAGWTDSRPVWTGSCPCQPYSVAGRQQGDSDERNLWPDFFRFIQVCRPECVCGEQVANAIGHGWLDGVLADLEGEGYACWPCVLGAHSVGAPHIRQRLYWMADTNYAQRRAGQSGRYEHDGAKAGWQEGAGHSAERGDDGRVAYSKKFPEREQEYETGTQSWGESRVDIEWSSTGAEAGGMGHTSTPRPPHIEHRGQSRPQKLPVEARPAVTQSSDGSAANPWTDYELIGPDRTGKYRRIKPGIAPVALRIPETMARLRALGNSICPPLAARFIGAYMDVTRGAS